jgi:hypothetical protein
MKQAVVRLCEEWREGRERECVSVRCKELEGSETFILK